MTEQATKPAERPHPNSVDYALGSSFGERFALEDAIDAVIAFANGDIAPDPDLHVVGILPSATLQARGARKGVRLFYDFDPETKETLLHADRARAVAKFSGEIERNRSYAIDVLNTAITGLTSLCKLMRSWAEGKPSFTEGIDIAVNLAMYPTLDFDKSGRPQMVWRVSGGEARNWVNFAALQLAAAARTEETNVARCQLPGCGRFFRVKRNGPGKPSRRYCPGTDHMERAHALGSTDRTRRKRRRDATAAQRPRKGK